MSTKKMILPQDATEADSIGALAWRAKESGASPDDSITWSQAEALITERILLFHEGLIERGQIPPIGPEELWPEYPNRPRPE